MKPSALVGKVVDVQPHPENDKLNKPLDIVTLVIDGQAAADNQLYAMQRVNVADRPSPDEPRYKVGDFAVMLEQNTILSDGLMQHLGLWDASKKKGMLGGKNKNRLRPRSMGIDNKITSEVALCPVWWTRMPNKVLGGATYQEGVLRFTPNYLTDFGETWIERTPCRIVTRGSWPNPEIENTTIVSIVRNDFMMPWTPSDTAEIDDGFSPAGENVAWNLGIEEVYEEKE